MANKKVSQLSATTESNDNVWLIMNNSGETETFKIQRKDLLSGTTTASGFTILCEGGSVPNITNNGVDLCVLEVMGTDILVRHFAGFAAP
jgi:hypothetical protein